MSRYNSRWSQRTFSQFINGKQKRFNLIRHTKNLERGVGKKVSASFTVQLYNDRLNGVTGTWGVAHITALRHVLALSPLWVTTLHNHLLGFSLVYEKPEASSSLFDHLPDVRSQRFHPTLFWLNQGGLDIRMFQHPENKNLLTEEAPQRSSQWAIRFPLIYLAWLDAAVNQSHISVMVFLLIASLHCGCIPFRLWSLSANEVRKAYGSCFQPGFVGC